MNDELFLFFLTTMYKQAPGGNNRTNIERGIYLMGHSDGAAHTTPSVPRMTAAWADGMLAKFSSVTAGIDAGLAARGA